MPRPRIDLNQKVRDLLDHHRDPLAERQCPIDHFERTSNDALGLIKYLDDHVAATPIYQAVYEKHQSNLHRMILGNLIQAFERFVRELAIVCVDHIADYVYDDRFAKFEASASSLAINFQSGSIGKALCESGTWLNNDSINERFRHLLKLPFGELFEFLFPASNQDPAPERATAVTLAILWQVRHNIAHNVGLLTRSDSLKLRLLVKRSVSPEKMLNPSASDLRHVKRFLSETASRTNERVGKRLALILTKLHENDPSLFDAQDAADSISRKCGNILTVDGIVGRP